ncbi:nucleoside deaminase, partial [bacterium]
MPSRIPWPRPKPSTDIYRKRREKALNQCRACLPPRRIGTCAYNGRRRPHPFHEGIMDLLQSAMKTAIDEARLSLREGNHGFGAVLLRGDQIVAQAHDREESDQDPTSHAETNVIRMAAQHLGKHLDGCILVSTHEPCPMCSTAAVWSGIAEVAYGYSIARAIRQGHTRIDLTCAEVFARAGVALTLHPDVLADECELLY